MAPAATDTQADAYHEGDDQWSGTDQDQSDSEESDEGYTDENTPHREPLSSDVSTEWENTDSEAEAQANALALANTPNLSVHHAEQPSSPPVGQHVQCASPGASPSETRLHSETGHFSQHWWDSTRDETTPVRQNNAKQKSASSLRE